MLLPYLNLKPLVNEAPPRFQLHKTGSKILNRNSFLKKKIHEVKVLKA